MSYSREVKSVTDIMEKLVGLDDNARYGRDEMEERTAKWRLP
jgi:hypothetical protein